jgi:hypothetical protein
MNRLEASLVFKVDRTTPFDFAAFAGEGSSPIEDASDKKALELLEVDLRKIALETMLAPGEESITGEETLVRLKNSSAVCLDVMVFRALWRGKFGISSTDEDGRYISMFFDGTPIVRRDGILCALFMYSNEQGWHYSLRPYALERLSGQTSAVYVE